MTCNSINHICFHHEIPRCFMVHHILHTPLLPLSTMSSVIEYTWGRKKFNLYWFKCTARQNKFSLQLTLNFVIIPECCVLEAVPVIIWKLFSLHLDYMHASLWINRNIMSFKKTCLFLPSPSFPCIFFTQIFEPSVLKGLSFDFEEQSLKDKDKIIKWNTT